MAFDFSNSSAAAWNGQDDLPETRLVWKGCSSRPLVATREMAIYRAQLQVLLRDAGAKERKDYPVKPQVDTELLACNGWLSPNGVLYHCLFGSHHALSMALGFDKELVMEDEGWVRLSDLRWMVDRRYMVNPPTMEQWTLIERWFNKSGFPINDYYKLKKHW